MNHLVTDILSCIYESARSITTCVALECFLNIVKNKILNFVEVLDTFAATIASYNWFDHKGTLIAHTELFIYEELRKAFIQKVLPQQMIIIFCVIWCSSRSFISGLNHCQYSVEGSKSILPATRYKHLLEERDHDQLAITTYLTGWVSSLIYWRILLQYLGNGAQSLLSF